MKNLLILFTLTFALWSCGSGYKDTLLNSETSQVDRAAQTGGNFLDLTTFPLDELEFGGARMNLKRSLTRPWSCPVISPHLI